MIVYNHTSKRSMKNSVTFISASIFSCDNGAHNSKNSFYLRDFRVLARHESESNVA